MKVGIRIGYKLRRVRIGYDVKSATEEESCQDTTLISYGVLLEYGTYQLRKESPAQTRRNHQKTLEAGGKKERLKT